MYELRRHGQKFKIYETKTSQYIATFGNIEEATNYMYKLNGGSGFKGETPAFMFHGDRNGIDITKKLDPVQEFESEKHK